MSDTSLDETAPAERDGRWGQIEGSCILLFLDHDENERLLADWLSPSFDVVICNSPDSLSQEFDLCIVDHHMFSRFEADLRKRKATDEPKFLPYLLICPHALSDLDPEIWRCVNDVISTPIHQAEFRTRIEELLERRQIFVTSHQRQQMIEDLHDATRNMINETEPDRICDVAVKATERTLDLSITAIWLADETGQQLRPVAQTAASKDLFDELPMFSADGNSLSWQAFASGDTKVFENLETAVGTDELHNPDTPIRSELIVPLGDWGVMNIGSTTPRVFDNNEIYAVQLLATNTIAALERAEREQILAQQTSQMEFFNSILRHDVLNAMTVIQARADILADQLDDTQHERYVQTILDWCDDVVGVIERVRTILTTLTEKTPRTLEPVNLTHILTEEIDRVTSTHSEVGFETSIPTGVEVRADELLSEVLGNVLTNAVDHNDPTDLRITVTVDVGEEFANVRIADTGSGVPDDRKDSIFRRGETGHTKSTGSGFGLFFVDTMIQEYGGDIWVEDNDPHGAIFVLKLPLTEDQ